MYIYGKAIRTFYKVSKFINIKGPHRVNDKAVYQNLKFLVERIDRWLNEKLVKVSRVRALILFLRTANFLLLKTLKTFPDRSEVVAKNVPVSKVTSEVSHQLSQWRIFGEYSIVIQSAGGSTVN